MDLQFEEADLGVQFGLIECEPLSKKKLSSISKEINHVFTIENSISSVIDFSKELSLDKTILEDLGVGYRSLCYKRTILQRTEKYESVFDENEDDVNDSSYLLENSFEGVLILTVGVS